MNTEQQSEQLRALRTEVERLTKYCSELAETVEQRAKELRETRETAKRLANGYQDRIRRLNDAIADGGFMLASCDECGKPVVCLDSGEGGLCKECAEENQ